MWTVVWHACPCMQKRSRREPLRLFVNNERCDPSDSGGGGLLLDAGQELHLERRKFTEKVKNALALLSPG